MNLPKSSESIPAQKENGSPARRPSCGVVANRAHAGAVEDGLGSWDVAVFSASFCSTRLQEPGEVLQYQERSNGIPKKGQGAPKQKEAKNANLTNIVTMV